MPPAGRILALPYAPGIYLMADRRPLARYFTYLPWEAEFAQHPWFGLTHDLCTDLPKAPPAVIYYDHVLVWGSYDMRDYMPCVMAYIDAHYRADPDFPALHVLRP